MKIQRSTDVNPRSYDASGRRLAAAARRQRVLEAARALFTARGYAGTTMSEIAGRADVSIKTVEAAFGTKAAILRVVVDVAIAGDDEPVALLERPTMQQLRNETDLGRFFGLYAGLVTDISGRLAPLVTVVEQAAQTHPEIAELWSTMGRNRLIGARHVAGWLKAKAPIWPDVDGDRAADILFLFNDPLVYRSLVTDRGWTREEFRSWLAGTYHDLLVSGRRRKRRRVR